MYIWSIINSNTYSLYNCTTMIFVWSLQYFSNSYRLPTLFSISLLCMYLLRVYLSALFSLDVFILYYIIIDAFNPDVIINTIDFCATCSKFECKEKFVIKHV